MPVYRASVVLVPSGSSGSAAGLGSMLGDLSNLASLAGANVGSDSNVTEAVALLKSRQFTEKFITELGLIERLYAKDWDAGRKQWNLPADEVPTLYDAYLHFDKDIRRVDQDPKTGIVTLNIDWVDAAEGAKWANTLVERLNETMRQRAINEANTSIELITAEMKDAATIELQQAIARTLEIYVKSRAMANVQKDYVFRVVDPAAPADLNDFVRPQRALYIVCGPVIGIVFAVFFVLIWGFLTGQGGRNVGRISQ